MSRRLHTGRDVCDALGIAFSTQQLDAITAPLGPGVIIAGAGSGKTTVMAARVVWLVGSGQVAPEQVLGLTFTRKAAAELSARIRNALLAAAVIDASGVDESGEQLVLTYDAFAAKLVSEHGLRLGVESDPVMITGASRFRLASRVVTTAAGPFEQLSRLRPDTITDRLLTLDSEMTAHLVTGDQIGRHARDFLAAVESAPTNRSRAMYASLKQARAIAEERLELASLAEGYADLKRSLGYVEFADQMAVAARLAREVPEVARLLRERFQVVLLDEYQDTSSAQATLMRSLFSGPDADSGRGHPVTAVGDPCQAIYGWRGAAASNILQFADDFPQRDGSPARRFALTVNRRSGPLILDVANALAGNLQADPAMRFDGAELALKAPAGTPPGQVVAASFDTWPEEVAFIGERISAAVDSGLVPSWSEIAVLTRRNAQIGALYADLIARDVPVEIVGLGGLLELPEIVEITSVLALLSDVSANPALIRLLTGPRWAIGIADLGLLGRRATELSGGGNHRAERDLRTDLGRALSRTEATATPSLLEALEDPGVLPYSPEALARFRALAGELRSLRRHSGEPVSDLVRRVITSLGLESELSSAGAAIGTTAQLSAFADAVASYSDVDGDASLAGLLAYLDAERDHGTGLEQAVITEADSVKLLTVHKAKGLEWDLVFVPGLAADVFPNLRVTSNWMRSAASVPAELRGDAGAIPQLGQVSDAGAGAYAEALTREARFAEDRLAYVAVTRARRILLASTHTWGPGLTRPRQPSDYFTTIAAHATVTAQAPPPAAVNPLLGDAGALDWPVIGDPATRARRRVLAEEVTAARQHRAKTGSFPTSEPLGVDEERLVQRWDDAARHLVAIESGDPGASPPGHLSATGLIRLARDPEAFGSELRRPMPRLSSRRERLGSRFHRWLENRFSLVPSLDVDPEPGDAAADDPGFAALSAAFERGQFATRRPLAVEEPFTMVLAGRVIRGRIDAVFRNGDGYLVVDWKTGSRLADPLQLALYRLAWAELKSCPLSDVSAGFYEILADRLTMHDGLADRAVLESTLIRSGGSYQV